MKAFPAFLGGILLGGAAASVGFYFAARNYVPPEMAILEKELADLVKKMEKLDTSLKEAWVAEERSNEEVVKLRREIESLEKQIQEKLGEMDRQSKPNHPSC